MGNVPDNSNNKTPPNWSKSNSDDIFTEIYEQHYLHSRHQELQRGTFTAAAITFLAALLVFSDTDYVTNQANKEIVYLTGLLISFLGFILIYSWNKPFVRHYTLCEIITIYIWKQGILSRFGNKHFENDKPTTNRLKGSSWSVWSYLTELTSGNISYWIFIVFIGFFIYLIRPTIFSISNENNYINRDNLINIFFIGFIVFVIILRIWFACEEKKARETFIKRFNDG